MIWVQSSVNFLLAGLLASAGAAIPKAGKLTSKFTTQEITILPIINKYRKSKLRMAGLKNIFSQNIKNNRNKSYLRFKIISVFA